MDWGITIRAVAIERTMSRQVTAVPILICRSPKGVPQTSPVREDVANSWNHKVMFQINTY